MLSIIARQAALFPPDTIKSRLITWLESGVITMDEFLASEEYIDGGLSIDDIRRAKLAEISVSCKDAIETSHEVHLSDGSSVFTFKESPDQANIKMMFDAVIMGATKYIYHPNNDGDNMCRVYYAADIVAIYKTMTETIAHHTTYHNLLKQYVLSLSDKDEVVSVRYGQPLTGEYLDKYNELISVAKEQQDLVLQQLQGGG